MERLRLFQRGFKIFFAGIALDTSCARVQNISFKNTGIGTGCWRTLTSRIRYSSESSQRAVVWTAFGTRTLRAVNVNWNDDGWNVNANSVSNPNRWNDGNRVFSRNCCISLAYGAGVFCSMPLLHPPSIRPISSNGFDNST